jgi:peptide/nickel transport system permease protein
VPLLKYIGRRFVSAIPTLILITFLSFGLLYITPGGPVEALAGMFGTQEQKERIRQELGLNDPVHLQYLRWIGGVLSGDFGEMIVMAPGTPIAGMLRKPLITTFWLTISGGLIALTLGLAIGALAAVKPNSWLDGLSRVTSIATYSIPDFWLAIILLFVFGVIFRHRWAISGQIDFSRNVIFSLQSLILPAVALGLAKAGIVARITRGELFDVQNKPFIQFERIMGLPNRVVIKDMLHNGILPIVTVLGYTIGLIFRGTFLVEVVFGIPGIGLFLIRAAKTQEYALLQTLVLIIGSVFILTNLLTDILYGVLDPRVRG